MDADSAPHTYVKVSEDCIVEFRSPGSVLHGHQDARVHRPQCRRTELAHRCLYLAGVPAGAFIIVNTNCWPSRVMLPGLLMV